MLEMGREAIERVTINIAVFGTLQPLLTWYHDPPRRYYKNESYFPENRNHWQFADLYRASGVTENAQYICAAT
jgi:hypothetical protein